MISKVYRLVLVLFVVTGLDACQNHRRVNKNSHVKRQATPLTPLTADETLIINSFDNSSISDWSYYYTHGLHVAGTNRSQAQWTADHFSQWGWTSNLATYNVYLNYPINKSMVLTYPDGTTFTPQLEEDVLAVDPTTGYPNRVPTFHGYSASGAVSGEFVYVGRGQQVDYDRVAELGVSLEGKIAVSMYGGPFRGLKVKNAQLHGMIGCIIFTDPVDDGNVIIENGYKPYPKGPARNPSSVQRGSVMFLSTYPGDPTTPGYPSIGEDIPRADRSEVTPQIPSIPISYQDAQPILAALNDSGFTSHEVNRPDWRGILAADYSTGPAPGVEISMSNYMDGGYHNLWDAIGIINGTNPDETLVIGNHRDAWPLGGAADPNSGTAIIVELSRVLGKLLKSGWKPRRNIVLCSWDGEEYGLLGSTEWVEEYIPWLAKSAVSYLNIDVGTSGPHPSISATPELHEVAIAQMKKIMWPALGGNRTMYDVWMEDTDGEVGVLGSGSDYTAFVHKGIGAIDMGSDNSENDPVYHYHSNYDSYYWMSEWGDPGFLVHKAMGQYLTLLAYHIATDELLPLKPLNYYTQMDSYYKDLRNVIDRTDQNVDTSELRSAIDTFHTYAQQAAALEQQAKSNSNSALVDVVNQKYRDFQRGFTSQGGLPGREFFKNLIFAPGLDTGYEAVTFPGITEAVEAGDFKTAKEFVRKTAKAILAAGNVLKT